MPADRARHAYDIGDTVLEMLQEGIDSQIEAFRELAMEFTDGQDPFVMIRDAAVQGLDNMRQKVASRHEMGAMATSGQEKTDAIHKAADDTSAAVASLQVPDVTLPEVDLGEGVLADVGEAFANTAAAAANLVIEQAIAAVESALDEGKDMAESAIEQVRSNADEAGEFLQKLTDVANQQVTALETRIAEVSTGLAQCESGEDFIELIVNQALELAGLAGDFEIDDLRQLWADVGTTLDEAEDWAIEKENEAQQ